MFIRNALLMVLLVVLSSFVMPFSFGQDKSIAGHAERPGPFQLFDNLFFVGTNTAAVWVLQTDQGLIVIDSGPSSETETLVENIRELGLDPNDIRYLIVTHGDYNQVGGAKRMQGEFGAVVLMTEEAWAASATQVGQEKGYMPPVRHLTATESGSVTLGRDRISFFKTPGHTPGVLSVGFTVYDDGYPHEAIIFGGVGVDTSDKMALGMYVKSIEKLKSLEGIDVNIPNGERLDDFSEKARIFKARLDGGIHPFVEPGEWARWLDGLLEEVRR